MLEKKSSEGRVAHSHGYCLSNFSPALASDLKFYECNDYPGRDLLSDTVGLDYQ